jgi:hypothetical protein
VSLSPSLSSLSSASTCAAESRSAFAREPARACSFPVDEVPVDFASQSVRRLRLFLKAAVLRTDGEGRAEKKVFDGVARVAIKAFVCAGCGMSTENELEPTADGDSFVHTRCGFVQQHSLNTQSGDGRTSRRPDEECADGIRDARGEVYDDRGVSNWRVVEPLRRGPLRSPSRHASDFRSYRYDRASERKHAHASMSTSTRGSSVFGTGDGPRGKRKFASAMAIANAAAVSGILPRPSCSHSASLARTPDARRFDGRLPRASRRARPPRGPGRRCER